MKLSAVALLVYLAIVVPQLGKPLMYDDANFALAIKAVAETGLPYGNQGWMSERGDFRQREQWALWHPPLYIYADGLITRLGGWTAPVMRLLGVIGALATAMLTFVLARRLTRGPPAMRDFAGGVAVALVLVCPLIVQSTLILDIDFPVLLPLTLLFLWSYMRLEGTRRGWLWLVPLFTILLWTKMTNPVPLVGVILVWQVLRGHVFRGVSHCLGIGLGGALAFALSWVGIGTVLGFPLDMPFGVNLVQWQDSAEVARRAYATPGAFIEALQPPVLWIGPGLVALGLMGVALRTAQLARSWQIRQADLLIGVLAVFVLGYVNKNAGWFPKYQVAYVPLLACLGAPLVAHGWCARPRLTTIVSLIALAASGFVAARVVRDDWALQRTWDIEPAAAVWLLGPVIVAASVSIPWRAAALMACGAIAAVGAGWSLGIDAQQFRARYATTYQYGTTGMVEAAQWLAEHVEPEQTYIAAKEVAIRTRNQRYVDQDNLAYFLSMGRGFDGTWEGEPLRALVLWEREPFLADLFGHAAPTSGFRQTARFGDYAVYEPG